MPAAKKPAPKPNAKRDYRYHIYKIAEDYGEVKGHANPVDAIDAACPDVVAKGMFVVFDSEGSEPQLIVIQERSTIDVHIESPKDLFSD